ncbi:phospholipase A2 inhibitor and Ly6/PLAUR domain-containing protein-like [Engystomops pustulosus]|uniref:phospholipase A2 inhibitor and Ly6/PLAUR domain-containing protein-like n=1 Tax=Engystomops pustulosus TaxID=76066 RepID=UPI003AFAB4E2
MKTALSICLVFSITIETGSCLVCQKCNDLIGRNCTEPSNETCASSVKSCLTNLVATKIGGKFYEFVTKFCATNPILCHMTYNVSNGIESYNVAKCCGGDLCNNGSITLPPINRTENGVQCPGCFAKAENCTPTQNIKCRGPQTKCYTFSGGIYNGTQFERWSHQGCTTENVCGHRAPTYPETLLQDGYTLTCSDPKP